MDWIEQQIDEINLLNGKVDAEFAAIDVELMDRKPDSKTWSINECLDHIIQSNNKYYATFDAISEGTYRGGRWIHMFFLPRLLGKMVLKAVSPQEKRKVKTAPIFYPQQSTYKKNLTGDLLRENLVLVGKLEKCRSKDLDRIIVISPVTSFVTYSLRDCIQLLVDHEKRHFQQAMRLKQQVTQK